MVQEYILQQCLHNKASKESSKQSMSPRLAASSVFFSVIHSAKNIHVVQYLICWHISEQQQKKLPNLLGCFQENTRVFFYTNQFRLYLTSIFESIKASNSSESILAENKAALLLCHIPVRLANLRRCIICAN